MKATIKNLRLEQFKGVQDATYDFGGVLTTIEGANGTGKTTIGTAIMWLFFDRDYALTANPNVRPIGVEEALPTVTACMDFDGREVTLSKAQKMSRSKDGSKITLTNTYKVNEVPKTERDFKEYLADLEFDFDKALACMHPTFFTSQTAKGGKAMRDVLFQMAEGHSDFEIASMDAKTADLAGLLGQGYKLDEIEAMNKATAKKAGKESESIPEQIVGMEKTKVDYDGAALEAERKDLAKTISDLDGQINAGSNAAERDKLAREKFDLQFEINERKRQVRETWHKELRECETAHDQASAEWEKTRKALHDAQDRATAIKDDIPQAQARLDALGTTYKAVQSSAFDDSEWKFDESQTYCKYCGQKLPEADIEERRASFFKRLEAAKKEFAEKKAESLESVKKQGFDARDQLLALKAEKEKLDAEIPGLAEQNNATFAKKNEAYARLQEVSVEPDISTDEEFRAMAARDEKLADKIKALKESAPDTSKYMEQKEAAEKALKEVEGKLAKLSHNAEIDGMILELRSKQRDAEQAKANAEKILYQLDLLSKKKNELLTDEINSHFKIVKWELFTFQKNGGYKETCVPMVDGFRFGESTNTGREILAKLDICDSLQRFFEMRLPIVADNMESLDSYHVPQVDTQVVAMSVTDDAALKIRQEV